MLVLYNFKLNILKTAKGVNDFKVSIQTNITAIPRFRCLLYGLSMLYLFCGFYYKTYLKKSVTKKLD